MNNYPVNLRLSLGEVIFDKCVVDDFLWVDFVRASDIAVRRLYKKISNVRSEKELIKIKNEVDKNFGFVLQVLIKNMKNSNIYEYSVETLASAANDEYERMIELLEDVLQWTEIINAGRLLGLASRSDRKKLENNFLDKFYISFDSMCYAAYNAAAEILNKHSYECQSVNEIFSREDRAYSLIKNSRDVEKEKQLELILKSISLCLYRNTPGFLKLLEYLPNSDDLIADLAQLRNFIKEFAPGVITKDIEGIDDIYINLIKSVVLSELSREEKTENIKLIDSLFYWNSRKHRTLREELYLSYKSNKDIENYDKNAYSIGFSDSELEDIDFRAFVKESYSKYKAFYFGNRFEGTPFLFGGESKIETNFGVNKNEGEQILFLYDDSLMHNGSKGFVITNFRFLTISNENSIGLQDIKQISIIENDLLLETTFGNCMYSCSKVKNIKSLGILILDLLINFPANQANKERIQQLQLNKQTLQEALEFEKSKKVNVLDVVQKNVKKVIDTQMSPGKKDGENQETTLYDVIQKNVKKVLSDQVAQNEKAEKIIDNVQQNVKGFMKKFLK